MNQKSILVLIFCVFFISGIYSQSTTKNEKELKILYEESFDFSDLESMPGYYRQNTEDSISILNEDIFFIKIYQIDDTNFIYNKSGGIIAWNFTRNDTVFLMEKFNKGACRKITGTYLIDRAKNEYIKIGRWEWYWKNGNIMDVGVYDQGVLVHRIRFSKKGIKLFENYY